MRILRVLAPNPGVRELEGTNTWVVGDGPSIVIDPGPDDEAHLREVVRVAGHVTAILLTHDHPDHAPGATPLAEMTGASVFAARRNDSRSPLRDGQVVEAGATHLRAVATPGHTQDHIAFFAERSESLFTGDAVLGRGTSVIDPPEGDLAAYLRSLRRMLDLSPEVIYPGHGPVVFEGVAKLEEYLEHRAMRERQVVAALAEGPMSPEEIVPRIYEDHPSEVHGLAARSVLAHLIKLEAEGRATKRTTQEVTRWSLQELQSCVRCGRPIRGRGPLCRSCSLAVLQESG
jgi:glyoxylase-like metal-dependent hydrolase (beta-lactamase superfamily II)